MKKHNAVPSDQLVFTNITNAPTKEAFNKGLDPSQTVLGKTGKKTLENLGLKPSNYSFEVYRGRLNLKIDVE